MEARTPLLDHAVYGSVYVAQQGNAGSAQGSNPFGSLLAMYLVVEGSGVQIKVAGAVSINQAHRAADRALRGPPAGPLQRTHAPLLRRTPRGAGAAGVRPLHDDLDADTVVGAAVTGPPATPQNTFPVSSGCATGGFVPVVMGGTTNNQAGGYGPLDDRLPPPTRTGIHRSPGADPEGLLGRLSHVQLCGEPQAQQGTCGAESQIGDDLRRHQARDRTPSRPARPHLLHGPL